MKKNVVNTIFVDEYKRKRKIVVYLCIIFVFLLLFVSFSCSFFINNKKEYVNYNESSDIDYKVYLKENKFFKYNYAEEKKQYIASLIDYINATFKYSINVEKDDVDLKYIYGIDAEVDVQDRSDGKSLYDFTETIVENKEHKTKGNFSINENVKIDYNKYNEIINNFIQTYKLIDVNSTLTLKLKVKVVSSCEDFDNDENKESEISLVIPLSTKTMAIDITDNLADNNYKLVICDNSSHAIVSLLLAIATLIILIILIVRLSIYVSRTRSPKDKYERELKKILNNYHSFIQKADNYIDITDYKMVAIDSFTDMLEIRDTINQPILMVENRKKNGVHFIIPSHTKLLYTYSLKVEGEPEDIINIE